VLQSSQRALSTVCANLSESLSTPHERAQSSSFIYSPFNIPRIAKSPDITDQFETLGAAVTVAAPVDAELQMAANAKLDKGKTYISQTWGLSETTGTVTAVI